VIVDSSEDKNNSTKYSLIPQFLAKGNFDIESPGKFPIVNLVLDFSPYSILLPNRI